MKILYLAEWDAGRESGVLTKIIAQSSTMLSLGACIKTVLVTPEIGKERVSALCQRLSSLQLIEHRRHAGILGKIFKAQAIARVMVNAREFEPDIIYWRESSYTPGLIRLLKRYPTVIEVNSDIEGEYRAAKPLLSRLMVAQHGPARRAARGFIAVTNTIARGLERYSMPLAVITNGFDLKNRFEAPLSRQQDGPRMVFVGTPGLKWHGVDRIIELAKHLPDIEFDIVGPAAIACPPNISFRGYLTGDGLAGIYASCVAAISTLAIERTGMTEACPLKSREYLANGLPVIGAYHDPDLTNFDGFLQIDFSQPMSEVSYSVRRFISLWTNRRVDVSEITPRIGTEAKEHQRLAFLRSVVLRSKNAAVA